MFPKPQAGSFNPLLDGLGTPLGYGLAQRNRYAHHRTTGSACDGCAMASCRPNRYPVCPRSSPADKADCWTCPCIRTSPENNLVYLTYAAGNDDANRTTLARGQFRQGELTDVQVLFETNVAKTGNQAFWLPTGLAAGRYPAYECGRWRKLPAFRRGMDPRTGPEYDQSPGNGKFA